MTGMPDPDADAAAQRPRALPRIAFAWGPALAYMALIWWLSSMPIVLPLPSIPWRDKAAHVMQYGMLGALVARAVRGTWPQLGMIRALLSAALITAGWGYLDEVHQAFVPGRDANAYDLLADAVGALVGTSLYGAARGLVGRKRHAQ